MRSASRDVTAERVAFWCGLIFIPAGLVKFLFHHWELHAFHDFGIPAAGVMEILVGVLETLGGVLLLMRRWVPASAVVLAVIMAVAFLAGGILHGSAIPSDTLAPVLLVAMLYLIAVHLRGRPLGPAAPGYHPTMSVDNPSEPEQDPSDTSTGDQPLSDTQRAEIERLGDPEDIPDRELTQAEAAQLIDQLRHRTG